MNTPAVRILSVQSCPTISGKSKLTYHLGVVDSEIQLRLYANSGGCLLYTSRHRFFGKAFDLLIGHSNNNLFLRAKYQIQDTYANCKHNNDHASTHGDTFSDS